jgi:hypothetical protein
VQADSGNVIRVAVARVGGTTTSQFRITDQDSQGTNLSASGIELPVFGAGMVTIIWESHASLAQDLVGSVALQATPSGAIPIMVTVTGDGYFAAVLAEPDGTFRIGGVPGGNLTVEASSAGFLTSRFTDVYVGGTTIELPDVELRAGLVDFNSVVNILDVSAIASRFLNVIDDRRDFFGRIVDLNADGIVNIHDITMAVSNFGRYGHQPWN